jgi:hypothetical protein
MKEIFNCSKTSPSSLFDMHRRSKVAIDEKKDLIWVKEMKIIQSVVRHYIECE